MSENNAAPGPTVVSRRGFAAGLSAAALAALTGGCVNSNPATGRTSFTGLMSPEDALAAAEQEMADILGQ